MLVPQPFFAVVQLAAISPPGVARGRFVAGQQSGLAGFKSAPSSSAETLPVRHSGNASGNHGAPLRDRVHLPTYLPSFAVVSARTGSAVRKVLPCPQSATGVHQSTFFTSATATSTSNFLRLPDNPSFPDESSVARCPLLRLPLESLHQQLCTCEKIAGACASPRAPKLRNRRIPVV